MSVLSCIQEGVPGTAACSAPKILELPHAARAEAPRAILSVSPTAQIMNGAGRTVLWFPDRAAAKGME